MDKRVSQRSVLFGVSLIAMVALGVVTVNHSDDVKFHVGRANNIIRRWSCPAGGYPAGRGRGRDCLCAKCPLGKRCSGGNNPPRRCPPGSYQDVKGQNSCKRTPRGAYNPGHGAPRPIPCGFGTYNNQVGQARCRPASPGYHVPATGQRSQRKCRPPTYQNQRGQRNCKRAPPGTYVNTQGATRATPCNHGTYNPRFAQTRCVAASPGNYVRNRGSRTQTACHANTYQHCSGQMNCLPCPRNMRSGRGARSCSAGGNPVRQGLVVHYKFNTRRPNLDKVRNVPLALHGGAVIAGGALNLRGRNQFAISATGLTYPGNRLLSKTLVSWVRLTSLERSAGAVIGIDQLYDRFGRYRHRNFDSIVYGEYGGNYFQPGSEWGRRWARGGNLKGPRQTRAGVTQMVTMTTDYARRVIAVYINGNQVMSYRTGPIPIYFGGQSRLTVGARHWLRAGYMKAQIFDMKIYNRVLSIREIRALYRARF